MANKHESYAATHDTVDASPVKSFFVEMLTRDIELEDAILDLLDNCIDGILRTNQGKRALKRQPYKGYDAVIEFDENKFKIADNCGGIPDCLMDYAFRMGRAGDRKSDTVGTVGVYGIGLKRAIFKMGRQCKISTQNKDHRYDIEILPDWFSSKKKDDWKLPIKDNDNVMDENGTVIEVADLYSSVAKRFGEDKEVFLQELESRISTHFAFILKKGFSITLNNTKVSPMPINLVFAGNDKDKKNKVQPYVFKGDIKGVEVYLAVGFTRPIPSPDEVDDDQISRRYSSQNAGWTVICNDRVVLYCDRTELTGWGEAGIPRFHYQFIAISGIVEFRSSDPSKLPTTTTKRGIEASSRTYLQVKNKMRDGMRLFIDYTNAWKEREKEAKSHILGKKAFSLDEIKTKISKFRKTVGAVKGFQYTPHLPMPAKPKNNVVRIRFQRNAEDIRCVAEYLSLDADEDAAVVAEKCFNLILEEARSNEA